MSKKKSKHEKPRSSLSREVQASLIRLLAIWQKLLGLSDWKIEVQLVKKKALGSDDGYTAHAKVFPDPQSQQAVVLIVRPEDFEPGDIEGAYNPEFLLVHELLHLPLELFSDRTIDNGDYYDGKGMFREQFINRMAGLLIELSKGQKEDSNA